jgi:DSF synthase
MNAIVSSAILSQRDPSEIIQHVDGSADFVISPQLSGHYDRARAVLSTRWAPRGIPSFNLDLLHELERGSQMIEGHFSGAETERPLRHIVVRSNVEGVFCAGGDLGYFLRLITAQDRARLTEYARAAVNVAYRNYTAHNLRGVTTVALLEGDALGGGFESALSCDIVIAEKHIKAGFPEVLFNMFPGMGGLSFLSRRVGRHAANQLSRTGRLYSAQELLDMGVVDQVVNTGEANDAVASLIRQREQQHGAHSAMNTVDRMLNPVTLGELTDVVRLWVDCAMQMTPRSVEWMRRLHRQQIATYGRALEIVPHTERAAA